MLELKLVVEIVTLIAMLSGVAFGLWLGLKQESEVMIHWKLFDRMSSGTWLFYAKETAIRSISMTHLASHLQIDASDKTNDGYFIFIDGQLHYLLTRQTTPVMHDEPLILQ